MSRRKVVAGNWKMNLSLDEATELVKQVTANGKNSAVEKIFFPPFPYLKTVNDLVIDELEFSVGGQNCSAKASGAFTGEVAAKMLREVGCEYVLVGHSERRQYFNEDARQLRDKTDMAFNNGLKVVYCFGEQLEERKSNRHFEVVKQQLGDVLSGMEVSKTRNLLLAYEPVWAIGTGETASAEQAQEMHAFVRKTIAELFTKEIAAEMPVLYGGSCNAQNAKELFACADVDGGLIGGASLKANDFCKIINSF